MTPLVTRRLIRIGRCRILRIRILRLVRPLHFLAGERRKYCVYGLDQRARIVERRDLKNRTAKFRPINLSGRRATECDDKYEPQYRCVLVVLKRVHSLLLPAAGDRRLR